MFYLDFYDLMEIDRYLLQLDSELMNVADKIKLGKIECRNPKREIEEIMEETKRLEEMRLKIDKERLMIIKSCIERNSSI